MNIQEFWFGKLTKIVEQDKENVPIQLFAEAKMQVAMLMNDTWSRFIKTEQALDASM